MGLLMLWHSPNESPVLQQVQVSEMAKVTQWGVSDFKALSGVDLPLPPLTILSGANSSGKSSILQSLLLLGQTVSRGGPVVLNGPLVRLGLSRDVVRAGQKSLQLRLDVQADTGGPGKPRNEDIKVVLSLTPTPGSSSLALSAVEVHRSTDGTAILTATVERMSSSDAAEIAEITGNDATCLRVTTVSGRKAPNRMYLSCVGLLPASLIVHRDKRTIERQMLGALDNIATGERLPYEVIQELSLLVDREEFIRTAAPEIAEQIPADEPETATQSRALRWNARELRTLNYRVLEAIVRKAAVIRSRNEWIVASPSIYAYYSPTSRLGRPRMHSEGIMEDLVANEFDVQLNYIANIAQALQHFGSSVRYLGPLRDEPKVVHGVWDERVEALPVGLKGELTAEVLTRRRDDKIDYHNWQNERVRRKLPDAVADWCEYLGIGDHINVLDLGKQGRGIELRVNGIHRDLTTIGVGASQLLPVLVAGLSAPARSMIMVEQPELHLHPMVQSRLADFFLYARPDVKFIVETHSEYLVTRIRRRVAEMNVSAGNVQVLFAEQRNGATSVRTLALSDFGDFEIWPAGFFDAQDQDALEIVRAVAGRLSESK